MSAILATDVDREASLHSAPKSVLDRELEASISILARAITSKVDNGVVLFRHRTELVPPEGKVAIATPSRPASLSKL